MRAVVTLCSTPRLAHLRVQLAALSQSQDAMVIVVWIGDDAAPDLDVDDVLHIPPGQSGMRLAAGRNAGADRAIELGAEVVVFLDADCVPGPDLLDLYELAASCHPDWVLCGPVTYLPPGVDASDPGSLTGHTRPHAARPSPPTGRIQPAEPSEYPLFWSLSFAMSAAAWAASPRFDERYEGYGAEDTDFAFALRDAGIAMGWVGGAHAYHQHHETSTPPWQHFDDILRNGQSFADRWGEWPMEGWLEGFEAAGAVRREGSGWTTRLDWVHSEASQEAPQG